MKIPWQKLPPDTLESVLEEIVTRDGTDYGLLEKSTAEKVKTAKNQLVSERAFLFWDSKSESASLISLEQTKGMEDDPLKD
jgi:uncharacterized protein YheU (UPF0270 family)